MAQLRQLGFTTCRGIVGTGLWVVTMIANRLMKLQMTRWNNLIWRPLCKVGGARWKQKRQRIIYDPPENLQWKNKWVFEWMAWAQRVELRAMWFSGSFVHHPNVTSDLWSRPQSMVQLHRQINAQLLHSAVDICGGKWQTRCLSLILLANRWFLQTLQAITINQNLKSWVRIPPLCRDTGNVAT